MRMMLKMFSRMKMKMRLMKLRMMIATSLMSVIWTKTLMDGGRQLQKSMTQGGRELQ